MIARDALDTAGQLPPPVRRAGLSVRMGEALEMIPDRSRVYVGGLMGPAISILEAMAAEPDRWSHLETTGDYLFEPLPTFAHRGAPFHHLSLQPSRALDVMGDVGALRSVSACSSQFASLYRPTGPIPVDVAVVQVSAPGAGGRFSLGVNGGAAPEVVRTAPLVIAEVNRRMPYLRGTVECDRSDFDALVEVEPHELVELPPAARSETSDRIGELVASLIPDGATVEYGIGAIPDAAMAALIGHRDLGLHSGLLGDAVVDLVEAGAMTGGSKSVDQGLLVASTIIGSMATVDWAAQRDDVVMVASNYSHGAPSLARQDRFCAINSAVEVGLDGSVNAEMAGDRVVSGPGGQPDFALGASLSSAGVGIVALPATARGGTSSRIVAAIVEPRPTTVPHYLADRVVTEFGVAELRGADRAERAARLSAIAAPGLLE